ncbi:hypothetical protein K503DRAFT_718438 [Rhizopogon vinicolor AM-OR11-026]|uniref:Transmembrane protein n=1 Tax=Rhizopogon vinicolor AM-OR11-026 TaxID=1314800 RepID=A0A1B7N075_9AGAM|nr:hypothetical protein K503DRAFT_718438 [Rhizopogon vinicolor AM-OR11-026]
MSSARLIRGLLKRLCQVLATLITSSAQRLRILLSCFQRFVIKICGLPRRSTNSNSPATESYTVSSSISSAWCPQATLPLPLHNGQITSELVTSTSGTQNLVSSLSPPFTMPVPCIPLSPSITANFIPIGAANEPRYENRRPVEKCVKYETIPELMRDFPNQSCPWLNLDWKAYVHPEGALYLYNGRRRTFTEANMDKTTFRLVDGCVDALHNLARTKSVNLENDNIELVVHVEQAEDNAPVPCEYYFVDHVTRTLFWLHENDHATDNIFSGLQGVYDPSHIAHALEAEYWTHCERYPNHELERVKLLKELRELVIYASAEIITSDASLSPFDAGELKSILELISHLDVNVNDNNSLHSNCVVARFMQYFSRSKFFNFCGLPCARLDADKSVHREDTNLFYPVTISFSFALDAMLFWAPRAHYNDLRRVWVDECINAPRWKDFSRNLMAEWTGITIYSTVMLAVDVSFLAVPNVNIGQSQSVGIIATYISIIFITGSLIVSLLLARQTQRYGPESAEGAAELLSNMMGAFFGMRALATIHSLPYAMLMWGMIFFAISLLYNVFKSTTMAMLASVVTGSVVVTLFILWFVWAAREIHIFSRLAKFVLHLVVGDT